MELNEAAMPKAVITAAILIIFLHWSGASFISTSAHTWLGTVQIERGWMVGIFLHLWFILSYVLYWQNKGAKNLTHYESINREFQHIQLIRKTPDFLKTLKEVCVAAERELQDIPEPPAATLVSMLASSSLNVKVGVQASERILPTIERNLILSYIVDFSKASHVEGTSSGSGADKYPERDSLPCYIIPWRYSVKLFQFELRAFCRVVLKSFSWHQVFLPWVLGWFACCSIMLRLIGMI